MEIVFFLNGKSLSRRSQERPRIMTMTGTMASIHCPKPIPPPSSACSVRYLMAMALGGVPMGVPMPPTLAAMGMPRAMAMRPLPSVGSCARMGATMASIMAAVAVLLMNMEKTAVTIMKPRSTISLLLPKGLSRTRARLTSRPTLVAPMARAKPPMKSIMIGSAKDAMIDLWLITWPNSGFETSFRGANMLSETVTIIMTIRAMDVVQMGMGSKIHMSAPKTKRAMTRCSTTVRFSMPKAASGMNQIISIAAMAMRSLISFCLSITSVYKLVLLFWLSCAAIAKY